MDIDRTEREAAMPEFLTGAEVAELLRTSPETIRYWRHRGEGPPSFKCGRRVLYAADELDCWIADMRRVASPHPAKRR